MKKQVYQAPVVELIEARVEKGFAGSGTSTQVNHGQIEGWGNEDAIFF